MDFSITGNLLTGPFSLRPDITVNDNFTSVKPEVSKTEKSMDYTSSESTNADGTKNLKINVEFKPKDQYHFNFEAPRLNWLNFCGMIPGVSTVTGLGRAFLGLIHTIVHLVKAIFDKQNRELHLNEAALGAYNFARGLVEATPIAGNIIVIIFDLYRLDKANKIFEEQVIQYTKENLPTLLNQTSSS